MLVTAIYRGNPVKEFRSVRGTDFTKDGQH